MNFIDHLIYTTNTQNVRNNFPRLLSDYVHNSGISVTLLTSGMVGSDEFPIVPATAFMPPLTNNAQSYSIDTINNFIFFQDTFVIDKAIQKHWYDMINGPISPVTQMFNPNDAPPYHIMYSYMMENTRMYQIFEKLLFLYFNDEQLGIASSNNLDHQRAFQWMINTENLFFKHLANNSFRNITSNIRSNEENVRRNAYHRFFGMDLAFEQSNGTSYYKSSISNGGFINLFEQLLREVWQAYINARNTSGANTTDYDKLIDIVRKIREILMARRGATGTIDLANYRFMNLSKEEYSSVGLFNWLFYIISYDSPLVTFLGCQANTTSERLMKIGKRVGIEAHAKSQALMDLSVPTATILRMIEYGSFEVAGWLRATIESQVGPPNFPTVQQEEALTDLLTIINNWEKATGHRIKNTEANLNGILKLQSNGQSLKPTPN